MRACLIDSNFNVPVGKTESGTITTVLFVKTGKYELGSVIRMLQKCKAKTCSCADLIKALTISDCGPEETSREW